MTIGVISDTHDALNILDDAFDCFASYDVARIIHCGDWKSPETAQYMLQQAREHQLALHGVLGNNDKAVQQFTELGLQEGVLEFELDGKSFAAYHGHHLPTLRRLLNNEPGNDVLLLGHSHKPRDERLNGLHVINPGSTAFAIPRSKTWRPTVAVYDTLTAKADLISLR